MLIRNLLEKLKLNPDLFQSVTKEGMSLDQPIAKHAGWARRHIYAKAYLGKQLAKGELPRLHHGIEHVSRAAYYALVFANLYRKHHDPEALALTLKDIKFIQIALLFHDSARVNEEKDETDHESGLLLYYYLRALGVANETATLFAEAVANKDVANNQYKALREKDGELAWITIEKSTKSIFQKLVHDPDCIDIIRARDKFEAKFLDFFQDIIMRDGKQVNLVAFEELAALIPEVRSLIHIQGDSQSNIDIEVKRSYQHDECYNALCDDINPEDHPILSILGQDDFLYDPSKPLKLINDTPYDKNKGITEENLNAAYRSGKMHGRGIVKPSGLRAKEKENGIEETMAHLELRKANRGVSPVTGEEGNLARSIAMLGPNAASFANAGFIILDPPLKSIKAVSNTDNNSGRQKKKHWIGEGVNIAPSIKQQQLDNVLNELKSGGVYLAEYDAAHTEVICNLTRFDAIYYNNDPCCGNGTFVGGKSKAAAHERSGILQAIFLQQEYKKMHHVLLPIIHYSRYSTRVIIEKTFSNQEIILMWQEACESYIKKNRYVAINESTETIKIKAIYGIDSPDIHLAIKKMCSVDMYYGKATKDKITKIIEEQKAGAVLYIENEMEISIQDRKQNLIEYPNQWLYELIKRNHLCKKYRAQIENDIDDYLKNKMGNVIKCCFLMSPGSAGKPKSLRVILDLAKASDSPKVLDVKSYAHSAFQNSLRKIKNGGYEDPDSNYNQRKIKFNTQNIIPLIKFADEMNIGDFYQSEIINLLRALFRGVYDYPRAIFDVETWKNAKDLLSFLIKENKITELAAIEGELKELLNQYDTGFIVINSDEKFVSYLELAKHFNVPKSQKKTIIMQALNNDKDYRFSFFSLSKGDALHAIYETGLLIDDEVFKAIVNRIGFPTYSFNGYEMDWLRRKEIEYYNVMMGLDKYLPNGEFSPTQRQFLREAFNKRIKKQGLYFFDSFINKKTMAEPIILDATLLEILINEIKNFFSNYGTGFFTSSLAPIACALLDEFQQKEIKHPDLPALIKGKDAFIKQKENTYDRVQKIHLKIPIFASTCDRELAKDEGKLEKQVVYPKIDKPNIQGPLLSVELQLIEKLLKTYIAKIESYQNDYKHGFWFFAESRAINRRINYELAKKMLEDLYRSIETKQVFYIADDNKVKSEREKVAAVIAPKHSHFAKAAIRGRLSDAISSAKKIRRM